MRVSKNADERKNEILDVANDLFNKKGFDQTSISDIQNEIGIARGTLYYHFKSKEEILDSLTTRYTEMILSKAQKAADNKKIETMERLRNTLLALNIEKAGGSALLEPLHTPQNALMNEKNRVALLRSVTPIISSVIEEGNEDGTFNAMFPEETVELLLSYEMSVLEEPLMGFTKEELTTRLHRFTLNAERLLGTGSGELEWLKDLFKG